MLPADSRNYITAPGTDDLIEDPCMQPLLFHFFKNKNKVFHAIYVSSALPNADTWLIHVGIRLSLHCYGASISAKCTLLYVQGRLLVAQLHVLPDHTCFQVFRAVPLLITYLISTEIFFLGDV